jgi:DNA-binding NarL/FixJ family response regulator
MGGGATMTPSIALKTLRLFRNPIDFDTVPDPEAVKLTTREIEVLEQLSKGLKYNLIADNLFLSVVRCKNTLRTFTPNCKCNKLEAIQKAKNSKLI